MKYFNYLFICILATWVASCSFLDIVPDERPSDEDAFKDATAAERFLYSCYAYIPDPRNGSSSLDLFTGDEVVTRWEHESFANFAQGNYTPTNPVINYWNDLFKGIRQCYLLKQNIGSVYNMTDEEKNTYTAEADFLIAYYHFILLRTYGPTILIKELQASDVIDPNLFLGRSPYDECVTWVAESLREVANRLPDQWTGENYGRATSTAAMAIRARLLLYAASPQFNGGEKFKELYANFQNPDGTQLISTTFQPEKWQTARQACLEAIQWAEQRGHSLYYAKADGLPQYPEPQDLTLRTLRYIFPDKDNTHEVIWGWCKSEGGLYGVQGKSLPRWNNRTWGGISPTLRMLEFFYTENGLPISEDPNWPYATRFSAATASVEDTAYCEGETLQFNLQREPRFYAWVAFHNGYYEVFGTDTENDASPYAPQYKRGLQDAKLLTQFLQGTNMGSLNNTGTWTGFINKKGTHPGTNVSSSSLRLQEYPWPIIRLAELYLDYAEACVECNDLDEAKKYLNLVRERAGIPDVDISWAGIADLNQNKMREIVHQERRIELYLENHSFYDIRRWGEAEVLGQQPQGLDISADNLADFGTIVNVPVQRRFIPAHYLMPLPIGEINKNPNLVQNPGYDE